MSIVLDTGIVVALFDRDDRHHRDVATWIETLDDDLVTTPLALAEMDHVIWSIGGSDARETLWRNFERGAHQVRWWADALTDALTIARELPGVGLTDASLVALAERLSTDRIATLDHERFRALSRASGDPFVLLPADAP